MSAQCAETQMNYDEIDLSFTATLAALEADKAVRHEETKFENLGLIARFISGGSGLIRKNEDGMFSLTSPATIDVLKNAYNESHEHPIQSWEELMDKTANLCERFNSFKQAGNYDQQFFTSLREFCVALAKYSMAKRDDELSEFESAPFRD